MARQLLPKEGKTQGCVFFPFFQTQKLPQFVSPWFVLAQTEHRPGLEETAPH